MVQGGISKCGGFQFCISELFASSADFSAFCSAFNRLYPSAYQEPCVVGIRCFRYGHRAPVLGRPTWRKRCRYVQEVGLVMTRKAREGTAVTQAPG